MATVSSAVGHAHRLSKLASGGYEQPSPAYRQFSLRHPAPHTSLPCACPLAPSQRDRVCPHLVLLVFHRLFRVLHLIVLVSSSLRAVFVHVLDHRLFRVLRLRLLRWLSRLCPSVGCKCLIARDFDSDYPLNLHTFFGLIGLLSRFCRFIRYGRLCVASYAQRGCVIQVFPGWLRRS